jgi:hypothetical protein
VPVPCFNHRPFDRDAVDRALGQAAIASRFTIADLLSILSTPTPTTTQASESHSLQAGTSAWGRVGAPVDGAVGSDRPHPTPDPAVDNDSQSDSDVHVRVDDVLLLALPGR